MRRRAEVQGFLMQQIRLFEVLHLSYLPESHQERIGEADQ